MIGNTAKVIVECDEFANMLVYSNLADKKQSIEVLQLAIKQLRRDIAELRKIYGQEEPNFARSLSRN